MRELRRHRRILALARSPELPTKPKTTTRQVLTVSPSPGIQDLCAALALKMKRLGNAPDFEKPNQLQQCVFQKAD